MNATKKQALRLLAYRRYFSFELREKLLKKGCDLQEIEEALAECRRLGYLNDEEDLKLFIEKEYRRWHGPLLIAAKLKAKKGWSKESAALLEQEREKQCEAIASFCRKHQQKYKNEKAKLFQALQRRGFERDAIFAQLQNF